MASLTTAQRIVFQMGISTTCVFLVLGFPCLASPVTQAVYRSVCVADVVCHAFGALASPGPSQRTALILGMFANSAALLVSSKWWCMGFVEWVVMIAMGVAFQCAGSVFLLGSRVPWQPVMTFLLSLMCYLVRTESEVAAGMTCHVWIGLRVASVMCLVAGLLAGGVLSFETAHRKFQTLYNILSADMEGFAQEAEGKRGQVGSPGGTMARKSSKSELSTGSTGFLDHRTPAHAMSSDSAFSEGCSNTAARCPFEDVVLNKKIGRGSFGIVYHAVQGGSRPVAVKAIAPRSDVHQKSSPLREARVSMGLVHPNVVRTYEYLARHMPQGQQGLGDDDDDDQVAFGSLITDPEELQDAEAKLKTVELWILQEWCDRGTLTSFCTTPLLEPDEVTKACQMVADIANGAAFLHAHEIIHGDLTGNNVLISSTSANRRGFSCKVCDFGLARVLEGHTSAIFTTTMGTVTHMPPELFQLEKNTIRLSKKADIYAAGILMWQVFEGKPPFGTMHPPQIILFVARGGRLKLADDSLPDEVRELYDKCVLEDPRARPLFTEIYHKLRDLAPEE
mmetsp:Transcript_10596/g.30155  ORF Transcript_10596/g.30155 Transcript_10596/m.30155 type:complete len:564 (+) Transcript_10596:104-1795(+)